MTEPAIIAGQGVEQHRVVAAFRVILQPAVEDANGEATSRGVAAGIGRRAGDGGAADREEGAGSRRASHRATSTSGRGCWVSDDRAVEISSRRDAAMIHT